MKKNRFIAITAFLIYCMISLCSYAYANDETTIKLQIDNPIMTVNDVSAEIDPGNGTSPVIRNDRTLVPIRAIIEAFGGTVEWNNSERAAILKMNGDTVKLVIDDTAAYFNNAVHILDVAPAIINDRTMLPIRFISESFDLKVYWDNNTRTVTVIKNGNQYVFSVDDIPPYSGSAYVAVNNNIPLFQSSEITEASFEYYSELDYLDRCGACIASIGKDIMPTEERGSIGMVKPTGWQTVKYDNVDGKYLYNRCHLIGYQLTGENANVKNLITGTRYLNVVGMLPFENMVADYVKETGNHVMYRSTPVFEGDNLLASGVLMEGYSVEDRGEGITFCVYCYNVQPGISINYANGDSAEGTQNIADTQIKNTSYYVLNTNSKKFHYPDCTSVSKMKESNKAISDKTRTELIEEGYSPCGICIGK